MQNYHKFKKSKMRYPRRRWKISHPKEGKKKEQYTICNKNNQANKLNCANPIKGKPRNKLRIIKDKLKKTKLVIIKINNSLPWDENEKYLKMLYELKKQVVKKYELETLIMKIETKREYEKLDIEIKKEMSRKCENNYPDGWSERRGERVRQRIKEKTDSKLTEINRLLKYDLNTIDIHIERRKEALEVERKLAERERKWASEDKEYEIYLERQISDLDKDIEIERKKVEEKKKPIKEDVEYWKELVYQKEMKYVETKKQLETLRLECKEKGRNKIETRKDINGVVKTMTLGFWEIEKFNDLEYKRIDLKNYKYILREKNETLYFWDTYELDRSFTLGKLIRSRKYYIREQYIMKKNIQSRDYDILLRDRNVSRRFWKRKIEIAKRGSELAYDLWKIFDDINKERGKK